MTSHRRVCMYIFNVLVVDHAGLLVSSSATPAEHIVCYIGKKDTMLRHICNLPDSEWNVLRADMMDYAENTPGTGRWRPMYLGWICDFETLRAFEP